MNISEYNIALWCRKATVEIRYGPDRREVFDELQAHLTDHRDALVERGLTQEEATQKALDAMGSAEELAPRLAALHSPFWGYALRVSRILLVILLVLSLKPIWDYAKGLEFSDMPNMYHDFEVYERSSYGGNTGRTLNHISQPGVSFRADGSTFTLTDAVVYTEYANNTDRDRTNLYVRIRQTSVLPRTEHTSYFPIFTPEISAWFSARDNLGNTYVGWQDHCAADDHPMFSDSVQSGIFTCTHECWISDFPADAQWVEIVYERDGRSYSMRIDLTGGGEA